MLKKGTLEKKGKDYPLVTNSVTAKAKLGTSKGVEVAKYL